MAMCGGTGDLFSIFAFDYFPFHYPPSPLAREIRFSCARRRDVRVRPPSRATIRASKRALTRLPGDRPPAFLGAMGERLYARRRLADGR